MIDSTARLKGNEKKMGLPGPDYTSPRKRRRNQSSKVTAKRWTYVLPPPRFELGTSRLLSVRSDQLSYGGF